MKNKYILKKVSLICLVIIMITSLFSGCLKNAEDKNNKKLSGTITVWSWNEELITSGMIEEFQKQYPGITINLVNVPNSHNAYADRLSATLKSGVNAPDVFLAEGGLVTRIREMNVCENLLNSPYNAADLTKNMVPYTIDAGTDKNGALTALTWQAAPGGFYYRRSLAKKYLGTDDPEKIQAMMNDMDSFKKLGETIRDKSNGQVKLIAGKHELMRIALANRQRPWVENNKIIIDPVMKENFDLTLELIEKNISGDLWQWSAEWGNSMGNGKVFGFVLPTWGLGIISGNAPDTKGDWALVKAPAPYFWGGTWVSMYKGSNNKELSWEFIKFITTNEEFLEKYAKSTGDFVNNKNIQKKLADSSEESNEFLGGQNPYKIYVDMVDNIDFSNTTEYDDTCNELWIECLSEYLDGKITKDMVEQQFKDKVKRKYRYLE